MLMSFNRLIGRFLVWRLKHIENKKFVFILSILIGIIAGLAAVILKTSVHYIEHLVRHASAIEHQNWLFLAAPFAGILITVLFIKFVIKDDIGHGVSKILFAISQNESKIKPHNTYSSIVACAITGGCGGSVGMEAPVLYTGSSIGANLASLFRLNYKTRSLLIGCGVAGAMAAIFKAPIAGLMFVLEVLMIDLTASSIISLLIAAVTATILSSFLSGEQIEFYFTLKDPFNYWAIPFYILLGIITGLVSLYFTRVNTFIDKKFKKIQNTYFKVIVGGLALSILIFIFPPLYGEGYTSMRSILSGNTHELLNNSLFYFLSPYEWGFVFFLFAIILVKVVATSCTMGSGGVGGVFAPSLFLGGISGFTFARAINLIDWHKVSESNFTLVGMAGLIAGVIHAPLTAIFLIAEITGGYGLFIPLIITSSISYLTIIYFEPYSLYTKRLAERGQLITHHKDKAVLTLLKLEKVIDTDFITIGVDKSLGDLVKVISYSKRNLFPVVDEENRFMGIVTLDYVRQIMFDVSLYKSKKVKDMMIIPTTFVSPDDAMDVVMAKFKESGYWNLAVVQDGKYIGFVSKANVFNQYRKVLNEFTQE